MWLGEKMFGRRESCTATVNTFDLLKTDKSDIKSISITFDFNMLNFENGIEDQTNHESQRESCNIEKA